MSNIYYHPESHGLKIFTEVEELDMSYEFNMFVVWQDKDGNLFYAEDSGCSCPEPFEDCTSIEQLNTIIGADGLKAFFDALTNWAKGNDTDTYGDPCEVNIVNVRRKVREHMTR